jgi:hypothetical protein
MASGIRSMMNTALVRGTTIRIVGRIIFWIGWAVGWFKWNFRARAREREARRSRQ